MEQEMYVEKRDRAGTEFNGINEYKRRTNIIFKVNAKMIHAIEYMLGEKNMNY